MSRVAKLTAAAFSREVYLSPVPVVVDVYADWCGPCRALAPLLEQLAEHFADRLRFAKVNLDQEPEIAAAYGVQAVPTLLFFRDGRLVDRVVGLASPRELLSQLERLASSAPAGV